MYQFFKMMQQYQQNQYSNNYHQARPYSNDYNMKDNMPKPMKWMMKMMMKNKEHSYDDYHNMENSNMHHDKQYMRGMFNRRYTRQALNSLDLGDRLVEKLQAQKEEMQYKVGNFTCILQEVNVLDSQNEISLPAMKKDMEQYNLPSAWFKNHYEELLDTCYEMATTLPAEINQDYKVVGDFGKINMAQIKMFMGCCHKAKAKLCMNYDIKQKIEENL